MIGNDSSTSRRVVHQLLTIQQIRNTGNLHGVRPIHVGMRVRFTHGLSSVAGITKERQCTVENIAHHPEGEERIRDGLRCVHLRRMVRAVWLLVDFDNAPLADRTQSCLKAEYGERCKRSFEPHVRALGERRAQS